MVVLAARDPALIEAVEALALTLGVELLVVRDAQQMTRVWLGASMRLLEPDLSPAAALLGTQPNSFVVGRDPVELAAASAELGYPVVLLPGGSRRLAGLLNGAGGAGRGARVVALVGASGGLGVSTLTVSLGLCAARDAKRVGIVELARNGAGLDLLLGLEATRGLRWADLSGASGELGALDGALLAVGGARILPLSRERPGLPEPPAVSAVFGSLRRDFDVVLVDAGCQPFPDADTQLLVVGADVRSVAAARALAASSGLVPGGLLVRRGLGRRLSASAVGSALGLRPLGVVRDDRAVARAAELGEPSFGPHSRKHVKDCRRVWAGLKDG